MTNDEHMQQLRKLCEAGDAATVDEWQWYNGCSWWRLGLANDQSEYNNVLTPIIARDGHPDTACKQEDREFIAQAANSRKSIQWAHDRIVELEAENVNTLKCLFDLNSAGAKFELDSAAYIEAQKDRIQTLEAALREIGKSKGMYRWDVQRIASEALGDNS